MKIRHVYTVTREFTIPNKELSEEIESFKGIQDEIGEYLYGSGHGDEKVEVKMQINNSSNGKTWEDVKL